jgi:hypothetical protein
MNQPPGPPGPHPRGVVLPVAFFALAGLLDFVLRVRDMPSPRAFWPVWEALGGAVAHWLVALGLWKRVAVVRSLALVYCLGSVAVYLFALVLAWTGAPVRFPDSVVLQSLYQVPSCVVLFKYLRSERASLIYTKPLVG